MAENDDLDLGEEKKSSKKWLIIAAVLVLLLGGGGAALFFLGLPPFSGGTKAADDETAAEEAEKPGKSPKEAHFYEFKPFIVNFPPGGGARYLQVGFSALAFDEDSIEAIQKHAPMMRNNLLLLLGRYKPEDLNSAQGKEALRQGITEEIQKVLDLQSDGGKVEGVFFTQFVMQ
ncbi:flagellar FliL protein [Methylomarinovum caldicuralii]|uniref:Flagellar protein FliL n=1 Tax=Methylomarinovum caldicuralii TaxID=438856 RepID=A0AAU9BSN6_9GAMM|nr:flagellar basal body-associated FliL family protein [Methylomarinovum caldicuralii]BCX81581.1 flagellar FliL protein [Methylomarinovum caldicuralii]